LLWKKLKERNNPAQVIATYILVIASVAKQSPYAKMRLLRLRLAMTGMVVFLVMTACNADDVEEYERCDCGGWYLHELVRTPTPPLNFIEIWERQHNFLYQFENVYEFTFWEWHWEEDYPATKDYVVNWENAFVLYPDQILRDFEVLWLGLNGNDPYQMQYYMREILFATHEFAPRDALALNLQLAHYLIPSVGFRFVDEIGETHRMLFHDGTPRGGCGPHFGISHHDPQWGFGWDD